MVSGGELNRAMLREVAIKKYGIPEGEVERVVDAYIRTAQAVCDYYYGNPAKGDRSGIIEPNQSQKKGACIDLFLDGNVRNAEEMRSFGDATNISNMVQDFVGRQLGTYRKFLSTLTSEVKVSTPAAWFETAAKALKK